MLRGVLVVKDVSKLLTTKFKSRQKAATIRQLATMAPETRPPKLHGRAFYESIGSPKLIIAPMVDRSEFAWRVLTRSYLDNERSKSLLAYTPMLHARLFKTELRYRNENFQPTKGSLVSIGSAEQPVWLDGNSATDRPLFVQFCANKPEEMLEAAQYVAPYCDAVDLNLGCPQGIARSGRYGAFLQEDWDTIYSLINTLHNELSVPITAKMRILDTREKTLQYAQMILSAGASILTVHGRRREQKGHNTGVADWDMIRYLRDNLPRETVLFANGNILNSADISACLEATGADGVMSAEGNLSDPTIFALPPSDPLSREYYCGSDGSSGYRLDGVIRRYFDIIYKDVLDQESPSRNPLYIPGDPALPAPREEPQSSVAAEPAKKRKRDNKAAASPNLRFMQGHLFQILRPMLHIHTDIRDALAQSRIGDFAAFEKVLSMLELAIAKALDEEVKNPGSWKLGSGEPNAGEDMTRSGETIAKYRRPWWVCQPHLRPLPEEAIKKGAMSLSKKQIEKAVLEAKAHHEIETVLRKEELVCG
jgi:tRNA-dihydrouridine synthase 1